MVTQLSSTNDADATRSGDSKIAQKATKSFKDVFAELSWDLASTRDNHKAAKKMAVMIHDWLIACKNDPDLPPEVNPLANENTKNLVDKFEEMSKNKKTTPEYVALYFLYLLTLVAVMAEFVAIALRIDAAVAKNNEYQRLSFDPDYKRLLDEDFKYFGQQPDEELEYWGGSIPARIVLSERRAERQMIPAGIALVILSMLTLLYKQKIINPRINQGLADLTKLFTQICESIRPDSESPQLDPKFMKRFTELADKVSKEVQGLVKPAKGKGGEIVIEDMKDFISPGDSSFEVKPNRPLS